MSIKDLPDELILSIHQHARWNSSSGEFLPILLVCKRWHSMALSTLHQHVVLRNATIPKFPQCIAPQNAKLIKILTIAIKSTSEATEQGNTGSKDPRSLWDDLRMLVTKIPLLSQLECFSLTTERLDEYLWLPHPLLESLVSKLPKSCEHLEIDTNGADGFQGLPSGGGYHLCDSIRDLLPQLRNLRLRLRELCSCLLEDGFQNPSKVQRESTDAFPNLQTLIINCSLAPGEASRACVPPLGRSTPSIWYLPSHGPETCVLLARCLEHLFKSPSPHLSSAQRLLIMSERFLHPNIPGVRLWSSIVIRDIITGKTRQVPWSPLMCADSPPPLGAEGKFRRGTMARLSAKPSRDIVGDIAGIWTAAEGDTWSQLRSGTRAPTSYLSRDFPGPVLSAQIVRPWTMNKETWKKQSTQTHPLWSLEQLTGMDCLSDGLEQVGLETFKYISYIAPQGWKFIDEDLNLYPIEDD